MTNNKVKSTDLIKRLILCRIDFVEKKMGVEQKVDKDEKNKRKNNFWPLSESLTRFTINMEDDAKF